MYLIATAITTNKTVDREPRWRRSRWSLLPSWRWWSSSPRARQTCSTGA